ncbi:MAG TPA: AtpZ/AtpI family protein [Paracoccaceae bacterium]|nr:AtpZ/AtpI family protein [Paracoccaceae bacterium]
MSDRPPGDQRQRLADLDRRLAAARGKGEEPEPGTRREEFAAASMAWRMVIELVMSIMVGGAMGWGLDTLFGTLPLLLIVFVMLGFAAGVRMVLRTAEEMNRAKPDNRAGREE